MSFDTSGSVQGVDFDDEDILDYDTHVGSWAVAYDGSPQHASLAAADVVAVPEPASWTSLASGLPPLAALARRRRGGASRAKRAS